MNAVMSARTIVNGSVQEGHVHVKYASLKAIQSARVRMNADNQVAADEQAPECSTRSHNVAYAASKAYTLCFAYCFHVSLATPLNL